jgi:peptidoglycan/LPS O-acetylase OafA/YrhL
MKHAIIVKPHYPVLDGLRGVAALMVVAFHLCEANAHSRFDQIINHGYLAVDFFFLLSGFVIGYAYDDRWGKITIKDFFKRRLVRLQPMLVIGMIVGAALFYFQSGSLFPLIQNTPVWKMLLLMLVGFFMLPVPVSMDIRGWTEMYPLNGPGWSLFFEYIANILYATVVRKFSKTALSVLVFLSACLLFHLAVFGKNGDVIGGWSLEPVQLHIGFARVMYPFFAGLLLCRIAKIKKVKYAFLFSSILVMVVLSIPRIGGETHVWMNGLYEAAVIIFFFPVIVYLGAGGEVQGKFAKGVCKFLGDISYPIYITHYPLVYIYTAWVFDKKVPGNNPLLVGILFFIATVVVAYACFKLFDEPVRKWLTKQK